MINFFLDTSNAESTLVRMQIQIRDVGHEIIPKQLEAWQTEDMHRKYPHVEQPNYVSAETTIYPRSHTYEQTHGHRATREAIFKRRKPMSALPRAVGTLGKKPTPGMHRPILRPALFKMLCERMEKMLSVNLKWVTSHTAGVQAPTSSDPNVQKRQSMLGPSKLL
jgi:hypothetical protein